MSTRDTIIDAGLKILLARGYEGTGLGPLLASVAVPKGSFYHFFGSKDEFAAAVLDAYATRYRHLRAAIFADASLTPLTRLMAYFAALEREMLAEQPACGCLYGVMAQSLPTLSESLAHRLRVAFAQWQDELAHLIAEAQQRREVDEALHPQEAAAYLIDLYEGAALRARTGDVATAFAGFRKFAMRALQRPR